VIDQRLVTAMDISPEYLDKAKSAALAEIERRRRVWLGDRPPVDIRALSRAGCATRRRTATGNIGADRAGERDNCF
jgi:hypothetical protein